MTENPFDLNKYAEELRKMLQEKIRLDIATLMPEGVWLDHIKREVEAFVKTDGYGNSQLRSLILEQLRSKAAEQIRNCMSVEGLWDPTRTAPIIEAVIRENMQELMVAVFGKALQDQIQQTMSLLPSGGFR